MTTHEELARENEQLRARLQTAQKWMQREVESDRRALKQKEITSKTRSFFQNTFEEEGLDILAKQIEGYFPGGIHNAPKYTEKRLLDAEIYWFTLQKYPTLDAFPILVSYQKILDAWIEQTLVAPWRQSLVKVRPITPKTPLDFDLERVYTKKFSLSLGRLFDLLQKEKNHTSLGAYEAHILTFWKKNTSSVLDILLSDVVFLKLAQYIDHEFSGKKRHASKVTFKDALLLRELCIGEKGIFVQIFS